MRYLSTILAGAACVVATVAQTVPQIAFTTLPGATVQAGVPVQLAWSGGDNTSAVTITLKQGMEDNLQTVALITGDATGNNYTWTPSSSIPSGTNYALQISQGNDDVNYSGMFTFTGGASSTSSTSSMSSTSSSTSVATAIIIAGPSGNSTIVNPTVFTTTLAPNATAVASSGGTGIPMSRNTTFSTASLSTTGGTATGTNGATGGLSAGAPTGTTTGAGGSTGTSASASASASGSSAADSKNVAGSSLALVLCAVMGMWVLN
ncbi:hypothetical protein MMC19_003041 [Ptychographa xylographoides]|nr:hypothetical protein [Ptychographa xylographoides]